MAQANGLSDSLVGTALFYIINIRETNETRPLIEKIKQQIPNYEETIMTYAEELRLEGKKEGKKEGEQKGKQEAATEIAKQLLKSGVSEDIIATATHLSKDELAKLKRSVHYS